MVDNTNPIKKQREREKIDKLMQEFLAKGGKIKKLPKGECNYWDKNYVSNNNIIYGRNTE